MKNPTLFKTLIFALASLLLAATGSGATVAELVQEGDGHDQKFHPKEALKYYLPAEQMEPANADILLRIARQYRHQMADAGTIPEKNRLSGLGLTYARRAVALAPRDSEAHLSQAICYAKSLELFNNKEKMDALRQVKTSTDKALSLDSGNDLAWYILGRWYQRVADLGTVKRKVAEFAYGDLPAATNDDAVRCFRKAISINPGRSVYHVDLGITYGAMDQKEDARRSIEKGLALPTKGKDDPETKKRGREVLLLLK